MSLQFFKQGTTMWSVKIIGVLFAIGLGTNGSEIILNECSCQGSDCDKGAVAESGSVIWKNFTYDGEHDSTETVAVRLRQGFKGVSCSPQNLSEIILINFHHPDNDGYGGWLNGTMDRGGGSIELQITRRGILQLFGSDQGHEEFNPRSYCVRRLNTSHSAVEICCGHHQKSCVRKCCPSGMMFTNDFRNLCVPRTSRQDEWSLSTFLSSLSFADIEKAPVNIRTGFPACYHPYNVTITVSSALTKFGVDRTPFRLHSDGTVQYLNISASSSTFKWENKPDLADYCVDTLSIPENQLDFTCGLEEQDVLIMCRKPAANNVKHFPKNDWISRMVYMAALVISIFFLLITAIVHFLLWEKQNIHAWTILCYVVSLTGFYSCLLIIYVEETRKRLDPSHFTPYISDGWCYALGLITHFMGVFAFSWLSVINFDLWWTFRILKPMNQRNFDLKRLLCYASFAAAVPTTVISVAVGLQISHDQGREPCRKAQKDHLFYPMYGQESCFLANSSQLYYFYVPVGVLLLANLIFYLCTSCQMLRIYNATRRLSDRNLRKQKQSCELFFKLFLVMGTNWIFQVILALVQTDEADSTWYLLLYVILDLTNMFQAVAIFVIFVCKRETLRALEQKYACLRSFLYPFRGMYRTPTIISRSTDGSTKMSRTEITKHHSIDSCSSGGSDRRRDSELINFS